MADARGFGRMSCLWPMQQQKVGFDRWRRGGWVDQELIPSSSEGVGRLYLFQSWGFKFFVRIHSDPLTSKSVPRSPSWGLECGECSTKRWELGVVPLGRCGRCSATEVQHQQKEMQYLQNLKRHVPLQGNQGRQVFCCPVWRSQTPQVAK